MSIQERIDQAIKDQDLYFVGDTLPPDFYAGFKQWLPMAESGEVKAMLNVGYCYERGEGVDRSSVTGLEWYRKAADLGDPRALLALYDWYKDAKKEDAEAFLQRAVATGDDRATRIMSERKRALAEQAQKAQEAAEKHAREAKARQDQQTLRQRSAPVVEELKARLECRDNAGARQRAGNAVQDGLEWAGAVVAATSLKIDIKRRSRKEYTVLKGASKTIKIGNTYSTVPVTTTDRYYDFEGKVSNPTAYAVTMYFEESGSTYTKTIVAGGTVTISKSRSGTRRWPSKVQVLLDDPEKTRLPMILGRDQSMQMGGTFRKIVMCGGLAFLLYGALRVFEFWRLFGHLP